MEYQQLKQALQTLGLNQRATLAEIKNCYRHLVKLYHPDHEDKNINTRHAPHSSEEMKKDPAEKIREINHAYRILVAYTANYSFNFSKEEFYLQNPEATLRRQFASDPLWNEEKAKS